MAKQSTTKSFDGMIIARNPETFDYTVIIVRN